MFGPVSELLVIGFALLLLLCIAFSRNVTRFGIPVLVIFIFAGMLMGSDGFGGIEFTNAAEASHIGDFTLGFILFSGGLATSWKSIKGVFAPGLALSTVGVLLSAFFAALVLLVPSENPGFLYALLVGAIVSCTDAASVFSILRSNKLNLQEPIIPLLEFESASNDPAASMLTLVIIQIIVTHTGGLSYFITQFVSQFCIGALLGFAFGYIGTEIMNRIDVNSDSLYPVCAATLVVIVFSTVKYLGGNGLLAVYITGIVMGNRSMKYKIPLVRFFDGISWLMQIFIFVTLGLLVFPKQMLHVWHESLLFAILLAVVIRPASVLLTLLPFKYLPKFKFNQYDITFKSKIFISWVGLRGASSIVFATYPLVNRLDNADYIFNIVFFVSLVSLVLQGTLLSPIAKYLGLIDSKDNTLVSRSFTDFETDAELNCELYELFASSSSDMTGKQLRDIKFPESIRIVMIKRSDKIVIPKGNSTIKENDILVTSAEDPELLYSFKELHSLS